MPYTHYDRLTALDTAFLDLESPSVHMHVGSVGIFDGGSLRREGGGLDFEQVLEVAEAGLRRAPRFRQKLARTPVTGHPVWVDDEHFNMLYHVRHTALPLPGDERQLKRLVGRIMSQKLDRAKPMWELWFVEGLEDGRFAVVSKVHHCLIDGISGVDLLAAFMGPDREHRPEPSDHRWLPRPAPGALQLLGDELWRRASLPGRALLGAARALGRPEEAVERAAHTASGFVEAVAKALTPASETPLNVSIGPHRRFDWTRFDLGVVREIRKKLGGTLNDVVLACVAGAVRHYLGDHGLDLHEIDFRVFVPVSTRTDGQRGKLGNRVSMLVASLPVAEADPRERLARITAETRQLKGSGQAQGSEALEELSDWTATGLLTGFSRLAASRRSYNLVVTNVPGPQRPVFLNGAHLRECYPLVPLFENQALGVALFSYDGGLYWGFNSDRDGIPDVHDFVRAIDGEFEVLRKL
jgi:diacylglycerol O-acyltransferase / wax synthase